MELSNYFLFFDWQISIKTQTEFLHLALWNMEYIALFETLVYINSNEKNNTYSILS